MNAAANYTELLRHLWAQSSVTLLPQHNSSFLHSHPFSVHSSIRSHTVLTFSRVLRCQCVLLYLDLIILLAISVCSVYSTDRD